MSIFSLSRFSDVHPTPQPSVSLNRVTSLRARIPETQTPQIEITLPKVFSNRLMGLSIPKYIERTNAWLQSIENKDGTLTHLKHTLEGFYRESFHPDNKYIPIGDLGRYRKYILQFFLSDHAEIKEKALYYYIDLCESDPIVPETSEGLLESLQLLIEWNNDGSFKKLNNVHLPLVAKCFALTLDCLLLHLEENLSGQKEEIKKAVSEFSSSLAATNIHNLEELSYWSNYIEQASRLIKVDNQETIEHLRLAGEVLSLGVTITRAILSADPSAMANAVATTALVASDLIERFKHASNWFQQALALKKHTRVALYQEVFFKQISKIYKFTPLINDSAPESQRFTFFSYIDNLEMAILRSPDENVRIDSLKMLIHFLYVNNQKVHKRALQALFDITTRSDEKLKHTTQIILELIKQTQGSSFEHIQQRSQFYSDVIQYLMVRELNIHFEQDTGGIPLIHLLTFAREHNPHFLDVFLLVPAINKNSKDLKGNTPFHYAAMVGNVNFLKQFAPKARECCKETPNTYGDRPIHVAISNDQTEFFNELLRLKVNPNGLNGKGETPLHLAVKHKLSSIANNLLEIRDVDINVQDSECKTPLNRAIECNNLPMVDLLNKKGAKIAEDRLKISPISLAARLKIWDVVCYYLEKNPLTPIQMGEVVGMAANSVNLKFIRIIITKIFNDKKFNEQFRLIEALAIPRLFVGSEIVFDMTKSYIRDGEESLHIKKIKEKKYDDPIFNTYFNPNQRGLNGLTILMLLAQDPSPEATAFVKKVIAKGGNLNEVHETGITAYHLAALFNNQNFLKLTSDNSDEPLSLKIANNPNSLTPIVKEIKKKDFETAKMRNHTDKDSIGTTAIMELAAHTETEALDLVDFLLRTYNNVNEKNLVGTSGVIAGATHSNIPYLKKLKSHGGDLNIACGQGYRPVHIAALNRDLILARYLLSEGAQFECKNNFQETPLHIFCGMDLTFEPTLLEISPPNKKRDKSNDEVTPKSSPNMSTHNTDFEKSVISSQDKIDDESEIELLSLLLSKIDPKMQDANKNTCLHRAVMRGKAPWIAKLLNHTPELFWIANSQGKLPIDLLLEKKLRKRDFEKLNQLNCGAIAINPQIVTSRGTIAHSAAAARMKDFLKKLFQSKEGSHLSTKVNEMNGQTPLHEAAKVGFADMIDFYIERKDLLAKDRTGHTPFDYAALYGRLSFLQKMISIVPKAYDTINQDGRTPLHLSCVKSDEALPVIQYLVEVLHLDCTATDSSGEIPMHIAARHGNYNVLLYFHKRDSKLVNIPNDYGLTPLHILAMHGYAEIICDLMSLDMDPQSPHSASHRIFNMIQGPNWHTHALPINVHVSQKLAIDSVDTTGKTPLMVARDPFVIRALLLAGASQTKTGELGETALHFACAFLQKGAVEAMLQYSKHHLEGVLEVHPVLKADSQSELPIHEVCKAVDPKRQEDQFEILKLLLTHGSPVNPIEEGGMTPLHLAVKMGNAHLLPLLIEYGANLVAQNHAGETPLHKAASNGDKKCIVILLRHMHRGRNIKDNHGNTPLAVSAIKGDYDCFKEMLRRNNYETTNRKGQNLYHILYAHTDLDQGHKAILNHLFQIFPRGIYDIDNEGNTCFHILAQKGLRPETTELIHQMRLHPQRANVLHFLRRHNHNRITPHAIATDEYRLFLNAQSSHLEGEDRELSCLFECMKL